MNSKELTELIRQNTRIILPEFGAFLVKDSGDKEFNPSNVSFSPFLRYNDGMLEVNVAKSKGISKEDAAKDVREFVETVKNELLEKGFYQIEGLGELRRDQRGSLSFTLSLTGDSNNRSEISPSKPQTTKKKTKVETPIPEDAVEEKKDIWLEDNKPVVETDILLKQSRRVGASKAKVEKLSVTKKGEKFSKLEVESQPEQKEEVVPAPLEETENEPVIEVINTPEPTIVEIPKPSPKAKPAEIESKANETAVDTVKVKEKPNYIIEPETNPKNRTGLKRFVFTLITIAVLVGLALVIKNYYFPPNIDFSTDNLSNLKSPESTLKNADEAKGKIAKPKDDIDKAFNKLDSDKMENRVKSAERIKKEEAQEEAIKNSLIKNAQKTSAEGNKYYVIAASFKNRANAENFLSKIKKTGYKPIIVVQPSGMNAVAIGTYNTKEEANEAFNKFKEKLPNLWVLKK
jgi:cell division protein FtsN